MKKVNLPAAMPAAPAVRYGAEPQNGFYQDSWARDTIFLGTPGCSAPTLHGQNDRAWHKHAYYANVMTGVASSATGLSRYYRKIGQGLRPSLCHTGDGCAQDIGFQTISGAAERNEHFIYTYATTMKAT